MVDEYWRRCDPAFVDGAGAESFSAFLSRVRLLRARLQEAPEAFIVVFAHGQVMQALRLITAMPDADDQTVMALFPTYDRDNPIANTQVIVLSGDGSGERTISLQSEDDCFLAL